MTKTFAGLTLVEISKTHKDNELVLALVKEVISLRSEMFRYGPVLEAIEAKSLVWAEVTKGTGIATTNGYFNKIKDLT